MNRPPPIAGPRRVASAPASPGPRPEGVQRFASPWTSARVAGPTHEPARGMHAGPQHDPGHEGPIMVGLTPTAARRGHSQTIRARIFLDNGNPPSNNFTSG